MKKHVLALAMAASMAALTACSSMPGMGVTQAPATEAAKTEAAKGDAGKTPGKKKSTAATKA